MPIQLFDRNCGSVTVASFRVKLDLKSNSFLPIRQASQQDIRPSMLLKCIHTYGSSKENDHTAGDPGSQVSSSSLISICGKSSRCLIFPDYNFNISFLLSEAPKSLVIINREENSESRVGQ